MATRMGETSVATGSLLRKECAVPTDSPRGADILRGTGYLGFDNV